MLTHKSKSLETIVSSEHFGLRKALRNTIIIYRNRYSARRHLRHRRKNSDKLQQVFIKQHQKTIKTTPFYLLFFQNAHKQKKNVLSLQPNTENTFTIIIKSN